jgi:multicomponent Na+:H+ antiporter subunit D
VLTAAAVFRLGGRVFLGWGETPGLEVGKKIRGRRETEPSGGVPPAMYVPVLAVLAFALLAGLAVSFREGAQRAAEEIEQTAAYQARVLDQVSVPVSLPLLQPGPSTASFSRSLAATACALGLAFFALSRYWPRTDSLYWALLPLRALRRLHSGHIGDYVAFLTFGVAAFGVALALLIHVR